MEYKLALFLVCAFVSFIMVVFYMFNRGAIRYWTDSLNRKIEGMTSSSIPKKLLRFAPDKNAWENGVDFYAEDFRRETIAMLQFFKERKHLVDDSLGGPSTAEKLIQSIPKMRPDVERPKQPDIDFKALEESLKPPEKTSEKKDTQEKNTSESMSGMDEYGSTVIEEQEVYREYTELKNRETEMMDEMFGEYFLAKHWAKNNTDGSMSKTLAIKLEYYDTIYSTVKYFALQTRQETVFVPKTFTKYFVLMATKYKKSDAKLKLLKQTLYNILRPTFVLQRFFAEYSSNSGKYPAKTDALFFINKCIETLQAGRPKNETDSGELTIGPSGSVHTFKDDDADYNNRDIMADGITITDALLIASYIYKLADMNAPHFVMSKDTFVRNYSVFLEKNRERKYPGIYIFIIDALPKIYKLTSTPSSLA